MMSVTLSFELWTFYREVGRAWGWRRGGEGSICRWTRNEDFQYDILGFWGKHGPEMVFSTLNSAGNYWKQ